MEKCEPKLSQLQHGCGQSHEAQQQKNKGKPNIKKSQSHVKESGRNRKVASDQIQLQYDIPELKHMRKLDRRRRNVVLNVGKTHNQLSIQKSVQKITKRSTINSRRVPEKCSDRSDTKTVESTKSVETRGRNECLSLESAKLSNIYRKGIFEKVFDGLGSTTLGKIQSSHDKLNVEVEVEDGPIAINPAAVEQYTSLLVNLETFTDKAALRRENETTPVKQNLMRSSAAGSASAAPAPSAPTKPSDHSNYHANTSRLRHVCEYCHKVFKSNGKLNSHVYSHTGERPYDCSHCGKAFSSKFKLVRHLLIHSEVRKFVCQICNRTFLRNDHLKNHYKIHDPMKKIYKCPKEDCDKEYSSSMSYKKHMAVHNVEDGDLRCFICGVKHECKEDILLHLKSHSGSRLFKSHHDKKFKCDYCDRLFLTRKDVTRHLVVHTGERDFLCQFCPQRFGRKDHLVRHIRKSHHKSGKLSNKLATEAVQKVKGERAGQRASPLSPSLPTPLPPPLPPPQIPVKVPGVRNATHVVITVDGTKKTSEIRKVRPRDVSGKGKKAFQKVESSVPNKKQVPFRKNKKLDGRNSKQATTTQIFLQNIPNVFIIPNNSIVLLRNESCSKSVKICDKVQATSTDQVDVAVVTAGEEHNNKNVVLDEPLLNDVLDGSIDLADTPPTITRQDFVFSPNFAFNCNASSDIYQQSQYSTAFTDTTTFSDLPDLAPTFDGGEGLNIDSTSFDFIQNQKEVENVFIDCDQSGLSSKTVLSEASRQIKLLESGITSAANVNKKIGIVRPVSKNDLVKGIFDDTTEAMMLNDSIFNSSATMLDAAEFCDNFNVKEDNALNAMLSSSVDSEGGDLLRNLLTSNSGVLSPLPGFSQIFQNSNVSPG